MYNREFKPAPGRMLSVDLSYCSGVLPEKCDNCNQSSSNSRHLLRKGTHLHMLIIIYSFSFDTKSQVVLVEIWCYANHDHVRYEFFDLIDFPPHQTNRENSPVHVALSA